MTEPNYTDALKSAGAKLANCAFNLAQCDRLTESERKSLNESRIEWDASLFAERQAAMQGQGGAVPSLHIKCITESNGMHGSTSLNVIRVEVEDDGAFTAVTDYWPTRVPVRSVSDEDVVEACEYYDDNREEGSQAADRIASDEGAVPVAEVGNCYSINWIGSGPIAPIVKQHNIKIGDKLFTHPPAQPPIDLTAIREVIEYIKIEISDDETTIVKDYRMSEWADKLARAIGDDP